MAAAPLAQGQAQHPLHVIQFIIQLPLFTFTDVVLTTVFRFPGLGTAVAIFSVYLVGEHFYKKLNSSSSKH
jgi:hypothetical protein